MPDTEWRDDGAANDRMVRAVAMLSSIPDDVVAHELWIPAADLAELRSAPHEATFAMRRQVARLLRDPIGTPAAMALADQVEADALARFTVAAGDVIARAAGETNAALGRRLHELLVREMGASAFEPGLLRELGLDES